MKTLSLTGAWQFRQVEYADWLPASVPGGAHTDLMALGRIPDPFVGDNELCVQWIADTDWEYRRTFSVSADLLTEDRVWLVCDGLDTLADLTLNGLAVGAAQNAFVRYEWDVKALLREGENELVIVFRSATKYCEVLHNIRPLRMANDALPGAPYLRKAPCQFGWDWGPKLPPVGIWRDIRLEGHSIARISDVHARQHHADGKVTLSVKVEAGQWGSSAVTAVAVLTAPDGSELYAKSALTAGAAEMRIVVEDPQLWWPNALGAQPLYALTVKLEAEKTLDGRVIQLGLRTLELRQQEDRWGRSFEFVVNGTTVFSKGANWIPSDSFPTRVTEAQLNGLIGGAAAANMNMLRVWGGGYYEDETFYNLCDYYGILVWQDFMFSCAIYPFTDPAFVENLRMEIDQNVRRLRNRACMALWCGNNEMEGGWEGWGWNRPDTQDLKAADIDFFYGTLRDWVTALDPDRSYWPSSPSSYTPHQNSGGYYAGDAHLWDVWHANKPFRYYREQKPRFASEFGFESLPAIATIATYAESADWNMTSYIMEFHQRNAAGNGKIIYYLTETFRMPKDFASLVYLSQVLQAEAMRFGIEHWRRNRARTAGALYWQINDCWPVSSWSSIDYFGRWKALHYIARRFFASVLLSVEDTATIMKVVLNNDTHEYWSGQLRWTLETTDGQMLDSGEKTASSAPHLASVIETFDFAGKVTPDNQRDVVFVCELWQGEQRISTVVMPFVPDKHLALKDPQFETSLTLEDNTLAITINTQSLARFVEVALDGADVILSDNDFDLPAGRQITVTCPLPAGWTLAMAAEKLKIISVFESYT